MDAQLEATYEGPEAVQRRQLTVTMTSEVFLAQFRAWTAEMRRIASDAPRHRRMHAGLGHEAVAVDAQLPAEGHRPRRRKLYHGQRQGVTFALADALCWLLRLALPDPRRAGAGSPRRRRCRCRRRPCRNRAVPQRPLPHPGGAGRGRGLAHLRRAGLRLQSPSRLGRARSTAAASWPANWKSSRRPCPASRPWPSMCSQPTAAIRKRPGPAPVAPARANSSACRANSPPA